MVARFIERSPKTSIQLGADDVQPINVILRRS